MKLRNTYILIIIVSTFLLLLLALIFFGLLNSSRTSPSTTTQQETIKPFYDPTQTEKGLDYFSNRKSLSQQDQKAKENLFKKLGEGEATIGVLYSTDNFKIEYIPAPNDFEVEIKTTSIALAKNEVSSWFKSFGFTEEGICNLPVFFYLGPGVREQLLPNTVFSPLPPGC